ncbi:MAG TPA: ornithine carbamoyltransferase [Vampirovibrionales bacterium]
MNNNWPKDFVSVADLNAEQINEVIDTALELKRNRKTHKKHLANKNVGVYTNKPSLRTRLSFELAITELGGTSLFIKDDEIGLGKREEISDVAQVLSRYFDAFVIRTHKHEEVEELATHSRLSVINALTDAEHPCQTMADLLSIKEHFGNLEGIKLSYVGDGNNVAISLMLASAIIGLEFTAITPDGFEPPKKYVDLATKLAKENSSNNLQIKAPKITNDVSAIAQADILYTDVWESMGQSKLPENVKEAFMKYQLNHRTLEDKDIPVLHCLPAYKGKEISRELFDKNAETIFNQAENRMHAQKSILVKLLSQDI